MLFPSEEFLWVFLPVVLILYYGVFRRSTLLKNIFLLIASLYFYAWGEPEYVFLMLIVILINYFAGLTMDIFDDSPLLCRIVLALGIILDLAVLAYYKYSNFTVLQLNRFLHTDIPVPEIALPIGISFFTFQAISYVVDVYRKKANAETNPLYVGLYISFFPQLIAGPIVRYSTIAEQIRERKESFELFGRGVERFLRGLVKKVIIANNMAIVADAAFELIGADRYMGSVSMAWLGAISYTLQIFFDFSAYSDMAIGLGKMFGFEFNENFNYPYVAASVTGFWRRWHISLSSWFRDYVYIPMGGNRVRKGRLVFNLFIVWLLTGIWHGANWTFMVWGLFYFVILLIEKFTGLSKNEKWWGHIYTLVAVCLAWVIFRADNLGDAITYIKGMFFVGADCAADLSTWAYIKQSLVYYIIAVLGSLPILPKLEEKYRDSKVWNIGYALILILASAVTVTYIVNKAYSPFIYFNF
jgi:alginate O-acetyltransferase complex protein AlgI